MQLLDQYPLEPDPQLSPRDVVKIQLDMLQNNDLVRNDRGIRIAFNFTSPENRRAVGSVEQFIDLVKNPPYLLMVGFHRAELSPIWIKGDEAHQQARLIHRDGAITYVFLLSRQQQEPYTDCWLTDSVLPRD